MTLSKKILLCELCFLTIIIIPGLLSEYSIYRISGNSMTPTYQSSDIAIVEKTTEIKPYDVVVFYPLTWTPELFFLNLDIGPIVHRVINMDFINGSLWYTTKGDLYTPFQYQDPEIPSFAVIGKVVCVIPLSVIVIIFGSIMVIIIILYIRSEKHENNSNRKNN